MNASIFGMLGGEQNLAILLQKVLELEILLIIACATKACNVRMLSTQNVHP